MDNSEFRRAGGSNSLLATSPQRATTDEGETAMPPAAAASLESRMLGGANVKKLCQRGMMYASGRSAPPDMVSAHKWFNIAALCGNAEAARLRREIAEEMSGAEIAAAQRAAREWMMRH
jgi:uncharacterized protein